MYRAQMGRSGGGTNLADIVGIEVFIELLAQKAKTVSLITTGNEVVWLLEGFYCGVLVKPDQSERVFSTISFSSRN